MNLLMQALWFQKLRVWLDGIWTLASLTCVPTLCALSLYWYGGGSGGGSAQVVKQSSHEIHTQAGAQTAIKATDIVISTPMSDMRYKMILVDSLTQTQVFTYSEIKETHDQELGNALIQLPSGLRPGAYALYADIIYPSNPLRSSELKVKIADITIDKE